MEQIPYVSAVLLPFKKHHNISSLEWFATRRCKIYSLTLSLPLNNATFHVKNLEVDNIELSITSKIGMQACKPLFESCLRFKIKSIDLTAAIDKEVMEQLSLFTENIEKMRISNACNQSNFLNRDMLSRWKLKEIILVGSIVNKVLITLLLQTCTELISIELHLWSKLWNDSVVIEVITHCPQLERLLFTEYRNITYNSLIAISERGLSLKVLNIGYIPNIPNADIARRCSHALSCIRHLATTHIIGHDANILIPYLTGLTSVDLNYYSRVYIPLLTQYCHKLTKIAVFKNSYPVSDILSLCRSKPLLQHIHFENGASITDTTLIELLYACPHLHTLYLSYETTITDTGILALSEHCPQLQWLNIRKCHKVTEAAVLQLLQRCRKLTRLDVSSSSLSEETWTQLDKNIQKRVSLWE